MFCPKCGSKMEDTKKFCTNCGTKLERSVRESIGENGGQAVGTGTGKAGNKGRKTVAAVIGATVIAGVAGMALVFHGGKGQPVTETAKTASLESQKTAETTTVAETATATEAATVAETTTAVEPETMAVKSIGNDEVWQYAECVDKLQEHMGGLSAQFTDYLGETTYFYRFQDKNRDGNPELYIALTSPDMFDAETSVRMYFALGIYTYEDGRFLAIRDMTDMLYTILTTDYYSDVLENSPVLGFFGKDTVLLRMNLRADGSMKLSIEDLNSENTMEELETMEIGVENGGEVYWINGQQADPDEAEQWMAKWLDLDMGQWEPITRELLQDHGIELSASRENQGGEETPLYGTDSYGEDSEYILPESSSRYYAREELAGLSREELRLARNEIYARKGRIFTTEDLKEYFSGKSWYIPSVEEAAFDAMGDSAFNEYELANRNLIVELEEGQ